MKKAGSDPKVKKTLVRNCEQKIRKEREKVIYDVDASSSKVSANGSCSNQNELDRPTLCSSEALAKYLVDTKNSLPSHQSEELDVDTGQLTAKMTKKLNFHVNDRMYKNLVELNAETLNMNNKKDKKPARPSVVKRDPEPSIEDFSDDEKDVDECPTIPVIIPKFKPVQQIENGELHKLVASFECL